jgi:hypothetical protein
MKKIIAAGLLAMAVYNTSIAQSTQLNQTPDAFRIDQAQKTVVFRLPETANVNDLIFFTRDNGVEVKRIEITREILNLGRYTFAYDTIPIGTYMVLVAGNSRIKYSFEFTNRGKVSAVVVRDAKLINSAVAEPSQALSFNTQTKEFVVSSTIPFREGSQIEVYDSKTNLMISEDVTADMLLAKRFPVKANHLQPGVYYVSVDGVRFGSIDYPE